MGGAEGGSVGVRGCQEQTFHTAKNTTKIGDLLPPYRGYIKMTFRNT